MFRIVEFHAVGANHRRQGAFTDDRALVAGGPDELLIVIADGAGSAAAGGQGAQGAVDAIRSLAHAAEAAWTSPEDFLTHLACGAHEAVENLAAHAGRPIEHFATTLILALLTTERLTVAQVGDGAVVVETQAGELVVVSCSQKNGPTNVTDFITDAAWRESLQLCVFPYSVRSLAAFSDGIELQVLCHQTKRPHAGFFEPLFRSLRTRSLASTAGLLYQTCEHDIGPRSGDDMTVILVCPEPRL